MSIDRAVINKLRADLARVTAERDEIRHLHSVCIEEAHRVLGIPDDGDNRWKWVLLEIIRTVKERDEYKRDAERYRKVRKQSTSFEDEWIEDENGNVIRTVRSLEYLDAHVDAMQERDDVK